VSEADDTVKTGVVTGEAQGDNWYLEVAEDHRKLGCWTNARLSRTADWTDKKNMAQSMRWGRKIEEGILVG
jgi:hypothetical protein